MKRLEKRALKAEKRAARRLAKSSNGTLVESEIQPLVPEPEPGENSPEDHEEAVAETL